MKTFANIHKKCLSHLKSSARSAQGRLYSIGLVVTLLLVGIGNVWGTDFTLSSASSVTKDGITVSFAKGNGSTAPTWYAAGLRLYAKNTVTISSNSAITSITFNWEKQGSKTFATASASPGTYSHPSNTGAGTWTGSATSITFTLGASGQLQLNTFSVTAGSTKTFTLKVPKGDGTYDETQTGQAKSALTETNATKKASCGGGTLAGYYASIWTSSEISTPTSTYPSPVYTSSTADGSLPASGTKLYPVFTNSSGLYLTNPRCATYTLYYDANGGTGAPSDQAGYAYNTSVTVNSSVTPTRSDYTFLGWATSSTATGKDDAYDPGDVFNITDDIILYAVWCRDLSAASDFSLNTSSLSSTGVTISWSAVTGATKYDLRLYDENLDLINTYSNLASTSKSLTGLTAGTEYYAEVIAKNDCNDTYKTSNYLDFTTKHVYTITYYKNDGSGTSETESKTEGVNYTISSNKFSRTGYSLSKWNTQAGGDGTDYTKGATYSTDAPLDLYAVWTAQNYTITLNGNGGSGNPANVSATYGLAAPSVGTLPTKADKNFAGYWTGEGGTGTMVVDASGVWVAGISGYTDGSKNWIGTSGTTIYAKWVDKTYINYRTTCEAPRTLDYITIDTDPTKLIYLVGETVSTAGAVVTAHYTDDTSSDVTASVTWTAPSGALSAGLDQALTASYTLGGVTKTATHNVIDVYAVTLLKKDETGATISGELSDAPAVSLTSVNVLSAAATGAQYTFKEWQISGGTLGSAADSRDNTIATVTGAITVTAVYYKPITVTWHVPSGVFSGPSIYNRGWTVLLPSAPDPEDYGCDDKVFYGWSRTPNYSSDDTAPTDLVHSGDELTSDEDFYAVFAIKESDGSAPEWTKTALASASAGTYLICTPGGYAFAGSLSGGDGNKTASAFTTANWALSVFNEDAPVGAQEVTLAVKSSGFSMYVAGEGKGYITAKQSARGGLQYEATAGDYYWAKQTVSSTDYWRFSKDFGSSKYAFLQANSNTDFRNYASSSSGNPIILLKKTAAGVPATYSEYSTSCTCKGFSFHTGSGTDEAVKTTNTRTCFEQVDASTTWKIDDYVIPSDAKFFVGWQDEFKSSGLGTSSRSAVTQFNADEAMYFEYTKTGSDGHRPSVGNAVGAIGTLRIWSDNNWNNCHVGFDPNGYIFKLGSTYYTMSNSTTLDGAQYKETEVITLSSSDISGTFQVNIAAIAPNVSTGVASRYTESKNLTTMGVKNGSGNNWRNTSINDAADANTKGFFRIDKGEGNATNWNAHWVPCWELTFDLKGGTGSIATTPAYVSVEAASKVVTIPNVAPTKSGFRFLGWSNTDGGAVNYAAGSTHNVTLSGNKTVYAVWKQEFTVTYAYAGGSGSCAGGSYIEGETVTTCATATKAGSTLTAWRRSDNDATVTPGNTFAMPASNVTLTAVWADTEYSLTQNVGSHTTKGHTGTVITSGMTSPSGLDLTYSISDNSYALPKTITISGGGQTWTLGTNYTWELSADKHSATLHLGSNLTISANVIVTVTEQARYTVVWDEHGITTTEYYASDDNNVTMKSGIADCGEKKFYGWTEDAEFVSHATTPPTMASSGTISGNKHYYAIYADATVPANPGYEKITSGVTAGTYIIVTDGGTAYAGRDGTNDRGTYTTGLTISAGFIASKGSATEVTVTMSGSNFYMNDGTYYLGYSGSSNDLKFDASKQDGNKDLWKLDSNGQIESVNVSGRKLEYNSGSPRFACYTGSGVDAFLYKKQTTTYENFAKTCAVYDITITTPSDGEVTTTPAAGTGVAGEGQMVTVNVTPNSCKYLSALKYNDGSDHAISIASTPYTFTMPASDVTVTATFADKTVSSIAPITTDHRVLMQNTSFVGEQIRVTYNNGETEDLAWNNSALAFSGYNMATIGNYTVTVNYTGTCGNTSTTYSLEVSDGIPVTFSDCGITTVRKYEPGDVVPVETTTGEYACSGWVFAGWSETSVAANSTSYTPVSNFSASTAKTLYAVYSKEGSTWLSAFDLSEMRSGAKYVIVKNYSAGNQFALTNAADGSAPNYLDGSQLATDCEAVREPGTYNDRYRLTVTPTASMIWVVKQKGEHWTIYSPDANKYFKITSDGYTQLTTACEDEFILTEGYDDSAIDAESTNASGKHLSWYNSSPKYWNGYGSAAAKVYWLTNNEQFSSTPPCAPQAAIFHGNGGTVIAYGGSQTGGNLTITEATRDAGITTPTAEYEDCDGKSWSFIGWANHEVDVTRVPVLTTDLLNDGGGNKPHTIATDGEEFWAVYTNQGEPMTQYGTISFSMSDIRLDYQAYETEVTKTVAEMGDYIFGYVNIGKGSSLGIQFQENTGGIYNKTSLGKVNSISFTTFNAGSIDKLNVYVGNEERTTDHLLTAAEMQNVGTTWTYYPNANESYVYITNVGKGNGSYACVSSISIDFGKGTQVWATTPDCKRVTLSGDIYATSTNGRGIMAVTPLHVNAFQLDPSAGIVISSNSSDVYFSTDKNANFAKAANKQPKTSVTINAGLDGNLSMDIYVHYKPSSDGDGIPPDVMVSANLAIPDPGVTASHPIHVRNLPEKFVIAAKVGATWYALPADMSAETNPSGVVIEVDETNMTATAPNTCSYTIWPVKTTNGEYDRYAINTAHYDGNAFGERVRFSAVNNGNKGLWANNATSGNGISNYAAITSTSDGGTTENTNPAYEWKITTTVVDGKWQYTLQTDQTQNDRYLRYWFAATGGPKWGTYASGEQNLYFLPVTEVEPFEMQVVEWYPTKVLVQTEAALASPSVKVNGEAVASPVLTNKGDKLWEISGLPLESNPTQTITVSFTADEKNYACSKAIPVILSRSTKTQASEPFATLGAAIYNNADLVVRDGAVLTVEGSNAANTFNDVTIYPTSKISVPSDKKLTVHALTFFGGIDEIYDGSAYAINKYGVPELSLKGTFHKSIAQIDYVMRVDDSQMYSLTVPYDVNLADITYWDGTSMGTLGDKLWVSAYDGAARANKDMSHTWIWEANFASKGLEEKLKAGVGYTISADLQAGVGSTYSILRMPMASNVENDGTELAKTVPVVAYGSESAVSDNHKGWNLVGNPYMVSIGGKDKGGSDSTNLSIGYLKETGTGPWEWVSDECRYVTIPADNGQDYWQEKFSSATLKPFKNFFVQVGNTGTLSFALASRQNAPARYLEAQKREVEFEINLANGSHQDHTGLLIAEEYSTAYEINADLEKMENAMAVYTLTGGYKLAYNALSPDDAEQLIPVGYVANIAGTYTFDLDETSDVSEVEHIWLTDYELSRVVDLIDEVYEFTTSNGRNESRFALSVELKDEQQTPTGILNAEANDGRALKFIWQDKMYIMRNGVIYDATGKQVR